MEISPSRNISNVVETDTVNRLRLRGWMDSFEINLKTIRFCIGDDCRLIFMIVSRYWKIFHASIDSLFRLDILFMA